jgi:hypothetical protein
LIHSLCVFRTKFPEEGLPEGFHKYPAFVCVCVTFSFYSFSRLVFAM